MPADTNKKVYIILTILVLIGVFVLSFLVLNGFSNLKNAPSNLTTQSELSQFPVYMEIKDSILSDESMLLREFEGIYNFKNDSYILSSDFTSFFKSGGISVTSSDGEFTYTFDLKDNKCKFKNQDTFFESIVDENQNGAVLKRFITNVTFCNVQPASVVAENGSLIPYNYSLEFNYSMVSGIWILTEISFYSDNPVFHDDLRYVKTMPFGIATRDPGKLVEVNTDRVLVLEKESTNSLNEGEEISLTIKAPINYTAFREQVVFSTSSGLYSPPQALVFYPNINYSTEIKLFPFLKSFVDPIKSSSEYIFKQDLSNKYAYYVEFKEEPVEDIVLEILSDDFGLNFYRVSAIEKSTGIPAGYYLLPVYVKNSEDIRYLRGLGGGNYITFRDFAFSFDEVGGEYFGSIGTSRGSDGRMLPCNRLSGLPKSNNNGSDLVYNLCFTSTVYSDTFKSMDGAEIYSYANSIPTSATFYIYKTPTGYEVEKISIGVYDPSGNLILMAPIPVDKVLDQNDYFADLGLNFGTTYDKSYEFEYGGKKLIAEGQFIDIYIKLFSNTTGSNGLDNNNDGKVDILDIINLIKYVFGG